MAQSVFADNTKISRAITSHQDIEIFAGRPEKCMEWATAWQMMFKMDVNLIHEI